MPLQSRQPKQNRCLQHNQQIVALCIDEQCKQIVKAVCPLQLYNNHLDHKFENIEKIHSEWVLYSNDLKQIQKNISFERIIKYMDGIIEELMFKIKQHLFLIRKEFQVKMQVYFDSKPVNKIKVALNGMQKCLNERFLDLKHNEIQNAKFFIEIYGVKKLLNDTYGQKTNFQKEILIAFAKVKEEMFMDYPKFNALVKAKEYQYCEIIKQQKTEISILKQRLNEIDTNYTRINEQHKQLSYQLGRTTNQLKNKQTHLTGVQQKLQVVMKKYDDQAQQAIVKAKQIKTKNIFGINKHPNLFRISDRIIRTGDQQSEWPILIDVGTCQIGNRIYLKVNRFDVGSWILLGLMYYEQIQKNQFEFDNYKAIGHGTYLLDNNRWVYSHHDQGYNCQPEGFEFGQDDIIKMQLFETVIRFSKVVHGWDENRFELNYRHHQKMILMFCVALKGEHTEVQLV